MNIRKVIIFLVLISILAAFNGSAAESDGSDLSSKIPSLIAGSGYMTTNAANNSDSMAKYGGISGTSTNPPAKALIDKTLSAYYGVPVAINDDGLVYWYYVGRWYNQKEVMTLPSETIIYSSSSYGTSVSDSESKISFSGSKDSVKKVPMPITNYIVLGFVGVALLVSRKIGETTE